MKCGDNAISGNIFENEIKNSVIRYLHMSDAVIMLLYDKIGSSDKR